MIDCTYDGALPALECLPKPFPRDRIPTLTEVATAAIYGAALSKENFVMLRDNLIQEHQLLWHHPNGPFYIAPGLELLLAGKVDEVPAVVSTDPSAIMAHEYQASRNWISKGRAQPELRALTRHCFVPAAVREKKAQLIDMTDLEACEFAVAEAKRLGSIAARVNKRGSLFYSLLSELTKDTKEIVLKGIKAYTYPDDRTPRPALTPAHTALTESDTASDLCPRLVHEIYLNQLDVDPPRSDEGALCEAISRASDLKFDWLDIRLSVAHAVLLLARFADSLPQNLRLTDSRPSLPVACKNEDSGPRKKGGRPSIVPKIRAQDAQFKKTVRGYSEMTEHARRKLIGEQLKNDGKIDEFPSLSSFDRAIGSKASNTSKPQKI